jgi:DNA-binding transcriptional MerR regulator
MGNYREYRIGSFARHLCVTQAFLKHYEDSGLLDVKQHENGYRYYQFPQAGRVFEYMRMHSYGVPVKQMHETVSGSEEAAFDNIDRHAKALQKTADRMQAVVDEHFRFHKWHQAMRGRTVRWEVKEVEPVYFLPHTNGQDFIEDDRIYEILEAWCQQMPVTKSALFVERNPEGDTLPALSWGLSVAESNLRRCSIPTNSIVMRLPASEAFIYHFSGLKDAFLMKDVAEGTHPAYLKMRELGLRPAGDGILVNEMKLEKDGLHKGFGRFVIPIAE